MEGLLIRHTHRSRRVPTARLRPVVEGVLASENISWSYIGVILSHTDEVHRLNRDWLQHDHPTDVLSFLIDDGPSGLEGEIYVDLDTAAANCARFHTSFRDEAVRYVIHGLLHLAGMTDDTSSKREAMREREDHYLNALWHNQ